jgi:hypothetical protein
VAARGVCKAVTEKLAKIAGKVPKIAGTGEVI